MRRRLIMAFVTALMLSIFCMCPARGQTLYELSEKIAIEVYEVTNKTYERYSTAQLNIREKPTTKSKVIGTVNFGEKAVVVKVKGDWVALIREGRIVGYVNKKYLSKKEPKHTIYHIPEYSGYKSFMDYTKITDESTPQWKLQQEEAYDGDFGIRMVDGRYCVAIGFAFDPKIGQYFDLILENGTVIPCVIADEKRISDTDEDNIFTSDNGCCTEFLVDEGMLRSKVHQMGDISYCCEKWDSPITVIKIYEENVL